MAAVFPQGDMPSKARQYLQNTTEKYMESLMTGRLVLLFSGMEQDTQDYTKLSDKDLESAWQVATTQIQTYLLEYYRAGEESYNTRVHVVRARQALIQDEITRRAK